MQNKRSKLAEVRYQPKNPTKSDFEELGSQIMSRTKKGSKRTFERRFCCFFGGRPDVVVAIWTLLDPFTTIEPRHGGVQPVHLLWALLFMKIYAKEAIHCGLVGGVDEKTS